MTYNRRVLEETQHVTGEAVRDVLSAPGTERGVVVQAVAGAGKTGFVVDVVGGAREQGLRLIVCTPTNLQAFELVGRIARRYPHEPVTFVPASNVVLPSPIANLPNVLAPRRAANAHGDNLIVGTFDKIGDAFGRGDLTPVDVPLADESFQADSARYYGVGGAAPTHLLVGDPGQISPFSTMDEDDRWRGLAEDPLQTAVGILRRNHPDTPVYRLPITRRLDPRAVPVARAFYPGHAFDAAVLPDVRQLRLLPAVAQDARTRLLDRSLDLAAREGWAHIELPDAPVLTADPETVGLVVDLLSRLAERAPQVRCERTPAPASLSASRIAVGVSHNDQSDQLRVALAAAGLRDVVVSTANKLQGLEFDVVVAWHPLAGLPDDPDGFHLDPGRLCVLLTRHRHACVVLGRAGDRAFLDGIPPATPAYLGWDPDPVLDGWDVHQRVFDVLEPYRLVA
jgi:hypothetical protein